MMKLSKKSPTERKWKNSQSFGGTQHTSQQHMDQKSLKIIKKKILEPNENTAYQHLSNTVKKCLEIYNIKCQYWVVEGKLQNQSSKLLPQETRKRKLI